MPDGIVDRDSDVWDALLAVADAAGGTWPTRARVAAVALVAESKASTPTPPKIPLQSLEDVRREAARVYREARPGRIETADASRLSFMLQGTAKMIEQTEIEHRISTLENRTRRSVEVQDVEVIPEFKRGGSDTVDAETHGLTN